MSHAALPEISVIIPCRGREGLLRRALASVQAQGVAGWEAIVVDDASPAPLGPLAEGLGDARIRTLRLARNVGPADAREAGLAAARAPICAFLDSDDTWRPDKLARQLARLRAGPPRVLVCGARTEDAGGARLRPSRGTRAAERIGAFLYLDNQFAQASGILAPTGPARAAGFGGLKQYEDHYFLIRAEAAGVPVEVSTEILTDQRADAGAGRLGLRDDPDRARAFLAAAGPMLTAAERTGFALRCLGPALAARDRPAALRLALRGLGAGPALTGAALRLMLRAGAGEAAWTALRRARMQAGRA